MYYYREQRWPPQGRPPNYYHYKTRKQYQRVQPEPPKYGPIYLTRPHKPSPSYQQQLMYPMRPHGHPPHNQQQQKDMGFEEFYEKLTELELRSQRPGKRRPE